MSEPLRAHKFGRRLSMEVLEDRTNPTAVLTENLSAFATDRVLVTLDSPAQVGVLNASPLAQSVQRLGGTAYTVTLNPGVTVGQAVSVFSGTAGVAFVEPDFAINSHLIPNDPSFGNLWGLNNGNDRDIDAPEAWNTARGTGATIVAVIDTGVQYTHPDLAANMWQNAGEVAGDGTDNDGNGFIDDVYGYDFANNDGSPMDDNGHGTHVAGTIGAVGNNGIGVTGVAWDTQIMALKFLTASGGGSTSGAVSAIYYAVDNGAKILNNSWGGGGYSQSLFNAISYANSRGVIFVAAAGNSASNNDTTANYPSNYALPNVVAVAATTSTGGLASFSSFGATQVDLGAPGSSILSTYLNGGYATLSGTSMATPHVAGALAVYWDANAGKTAGEVIQRLKDTVDPLASLAGKTVTGGQLNLQKLLTGTVPPPPPPPPAFDPGARVTAGAFSGSGNALNTVRLTFSEAINAATFTPADVVLTGPGGTIATGVTQVNATTFDVTFANQSAFGVYSVTVGPNVLDLAGNAMNQDGDLTNGENPADIYSTSVTISPPYQTFSYTSNTQVAIRDRSTVTSALTIPTVTGTTNVPISDLNVTVRLTHTWTSDLRLFLIAPNGRTIELFNRRGGSGDNLTNTVFNDEATTAIAAGAAPFSGSFRPEQLLSAFDGLSAAGTWRLQVQDVARGDVGVLQSFTLTFTTGTAPGGQGVGMLAFREGDTDAPQELKGDSAAPVVQEQFAQPVSPVVRVTTPTPVPVVAPAVAPGSPEAAPPVVAGSPFVGPAEAAPVLEVAVPPVDSPTVVESTPAVDSEVVPLTVAPVGGTPVYAVDLHSLFTLLEKDDPFAAFRL